MNPIILLKKLQLLEGNTALDIGTKSGKNAIWLNDLGFQTTAIDIKPLPKPEKSIQFIQTDIDDFLKQNKKQYDVVVARHVLPFLSNPKQTLENIMKISSTLYVTMFGPKDDWADRYPTMTHEEMKSMFRDWDIRHRAEVFEHAPTYTNEMKFWHINTIVAAR